MTRADIERRLAEAPSRRHHGLTQAEAELARRLAAVLGWGGAWRALDCLWTAVREPGGAEAVAEAVGVQAVNK